MIVLSGIATFAFLGWLTWITTHLVMEGVPAEDRATLLQTMVMAATGLVVSGVLAARTTDAQDPFSFVSALTRALRGMSGRWFGRGGYY
jgi:cyanate permease